MPKQSRKSAVKPADTCAEPNVIAALTRVLDDAKAGRIAAVGIAFVTSERATGSTSGIGATPPDIVAAKLLNSAITELQHEWFHAVRGR